MRKLSSWVPFSCIAVLAFPACAAEVGETDQDGIGKVAQALGTFTQLALPSSPNRALHIGPTFAVFSSDILTSSTPVVLFTGTGATRSVPFAGNGFLTAAGSDNTVTIALLNTFSGQSQLYVLDGDAGGTGAVSWRALGNPRSGSVSKIAMSSTHVYFDDANGVYSVSRAGGTPVPLAANSGGVSHELLGRDGSRLYLQSSASGSPFTLSWVSVSGGARTPLATRSNEFADFSTDPNHVYWVENGTVSSIRRVPKAGGAVEKVLGGEDRTYRAPVADGSLIWFIQEDAGPVRRLRRMNLANNNFVSVSYPFLPVSELLRTSGGLYLAPLAVAPNQYGLYSTPL